jgi:nucleoside-diphosphate-sugar epimerase
VLAAHCGQSCWYHRRDDIWSTIPPPQLDLWLLQLPRKALVTGGNGFVGRTIVNMLLDQGTRQDPTPGGHAGAGADSLHLLRCLAGCDVTVFDIAKGFDDDRVKFIVGNLLSKVRARARALQSPVPRTEWVVNV